MMDETPRFETQPDAYQSTFEVCINGLVPFGVLVELGEVEVTLQEMRTVLIGHFGDHSELYGFLERLRANALEVVEVRRIGMENYAIIRPEGPECHDIERRPPNRCGWSARSSGCWDPC